MLTPFIISEPTIAIVPIKAVTHSFLNDENG